MAAKEARSRARLTVDIDVELRRRIRVAAAERDLSIRDYVVAILRHALDAEGRGAPPTEPAAWSQLSVPAFARDWQSEEDRAYDRLSQG